MTRLARLLAERQSHRGKFASHCKYRIAEPLNRQGDGGNDDRRNDDRRDLRSAPARGAGGAAMNDMEENRKETESRSERNAEGWAAAMSRAVNYLSPVWGMLRWSNLPPWWVWMLGFGIAWALIVIVARLAGAELDPQAATRPGAVGKMIAAIYARAPVS
jgi:hypothetical protein